jgi:hypothetical protein
MCWHPETEAHTLEMVLCYRCQHSLSWGCNVERLPQKKMGPGRRKTDPDVVLDPVALSCRMCQANRWESVYEADEMARRERDRVAQLSAERHLQSEASVSFPLLPDEDGQVSLF